MLRPLALILYLAAPAAQACAVAEGCPMGLPPSGCTLVRVDADHICMDDPSAPGGYVIVPVGGTVPPDALDCGPGGCNPTAPVPAVGPSLGARLLGLLGISR